MEAKSNNKVIVILGPTGIGKTDLAIKIARMFNLNIISADAFQVYKGMNIGTNKPHKDEINMLRYYGIDLVDPSHSFNIFEFQKYARNIINNSTFNSLIVGGSMLYLDSVIYDYSLRINFDNTNKYDSISTHDLYEKLKSLDPLSASEIKEQNRNRIITALNYFLQFNESIKLNNNKSNSYYDTFIIYLKPENKQILNKLNEKRIDLMFDNGWKEEVKLILKKYPNFLNFNSSKAIGYREIATSLINNTEINKENIIIKTNQFVKHQLSWYKKNENKFDIILSNKNIDETLIKKIKKFLEK